MDEHPKNPYRRPVSASDAQNSPAERRPGLRQLPKDMEDLALGRTESLPRKRPAPRPLQDDREGAVIPGVRNADARAVYDARVSALRADLAAGRDAQLRQGLTAVRKLALWRARNVTDYRAFAESVVGVPAALAEELVQAANADEQDAVWPEHVIALLLRVEAALLGHAAQAGGAAVQLRLSDAGLRLSLDLPVSNVGLAVEMLADAGRAADGLRFFLRGANTERRTGGPDAWAERPHDRDPRDARGARHDPRAERRDPRRDARGARPDPRADRRDPRDARHDPRADRRDPRDARHDPRTDRRDPRAERRDPDQAERRDARSPLRKGPGGPAHKSRTDAGFKPFRGRNQSQRDRNPFKRGNP